MENFIVSARKYRPQNFATVIGQAHITTTLKNAIKNNQLAHAFLFCGPRGVGKTTCARILAKTINCIHPTAEGESCNECDNCLSFDKGNSLNIHELDAASNNSVDDMRILTEQVRFSPQAGSKYKVYIIDEVHMLSSSAFNAFLKTLEEPPPHAIFILATTEKHKILPTILSRCQIFDFKRITNNDTVDHLLEICEKENIKAEKTALHVIAQKSEGCMRDSLSILDKIVSFTNGEFTYKNTLEHLNILDEDYFFQLYQFLLKQDTGSALLMFDEINRKGFEGDTFIAGFAEFFRNMLVSADPKVVSLLEVADDFKEKYASAAKQANLSFVISALNVLNESEINYRLSKNKRLHVEMMLIKLCYLQQALQLVENESGLVKKKLNDNPRTVSFRALKVVKAAEAATPKFQPALSEAKLIVEETLPSITKTATASTTKEEAPASSAQTTKSPSPSLGSLQKIRQQISSKNSENNTSVPLSEETLTDAWKSFIEFLKTSNNHTAASNFLQAYTTVTSDTSFEIITESEIQRSFIDAERATLIGHMQHWFKNRSLSYKVTIKEKEGEIIPVEVPIGKKQIYQNMIEEYPLIKELKEKLKLDLN